MAATTKWDLISTEQREALDAMSFGGDCSFCGEPLPTEGAFARHFVVTDYRYPNLGECPAKLAAGFTPMRFA